MAGQSKTIIQYTNLPERLRIRHAPIEMKYSRSFKDIITHSESVLDAIFTDIGNTVTISRDRLIMNIFTELEENQVIVIAGHAGFGKSALVKKFIEVLSNDYFCFAFQAAEFAKNSVDAAFLDIYFGLNCQRFLDLLAGQERKIIFLDGVDRLLEASTRDAFIQLLGCIQKDTGIKLILTCREYSLQTVPDAFLDRRPLQYTIFNVPPLTDAELAQVRTGYPKYWKSSAKSKIKKALTITLFA